jgi:ankyrin repeat protein
MRGRASLNIRLFDAIQTKDVNEVQKWLAAGADPNCRSADGYTPLGFAVELRASPIVEALLKAGADPEREMVTDPLFEALKACDIATARLLIAAGADINRKSENNHTPLMMAACQCSAEIVQELINLGANPHAQDDDGRTALTFARRENRKDVIMLLEQLGVDDPTDMEKHPEEKLLEELMQAVSNCDLQQVRELIERGAPLNRTPRNSPHTPLTASTTCVDTSILLALLEAGALPSKIGFWPPLGWAAALGANQSLRPLLDAGALVDERNADGDTPLIAAAGRGNNEGSRMLITAGADVNAESPYGRTPLAMAYEYEQRYRRRNPAVDVLLEAGAINLGAYTSAFQDWERPLEF